VYAEAVVEDEEYQSVVVLLAAGAGAAH